VASCLQGKAVAASLVAPGILSSTSPVHWRLIGSAILRASKTACVRSRFREFTQRWRGFGLQQQRLLRSRRMLASRR
jgi:hypothetical protein